MHSPKITIITAVYNRDSTIAEALRSVQSQSYLNVEHIIIDGVSTDNTLNIIRQNITNNSIIISEPDSGIYDALNKGILHSSGDVIGFMHSDDFYADRHVLDIVATVFSDPSVDAVYADLDYVSKEDKTKVVRRWRSRPFNTNKLKYGWMPPHPTLFLRRRVIDEFGGFDTRFSIAADYDAILRYFGSGKINSVYVPRVFIKMRVGGESNKSLMKILCKMKEDYRALRRNKVGGIRSLLVKNLSKLNQFIP